MSQAGGFSDAERAAMRRALALAATPQVPDGPNPHVGCVLLAPDGRIVAEGFHRGAGTPHAETMALSEAGAAARGTTAVVTLEPCNHTGRTGPCVQALLDAGVNAVVYAQADPNPRAAGGAAALRSAGVETRQGLLGDEALALNREWTFAVTHGRPWVTWKSAATLDGRSAASDGTSRWISSSAARADAHLLRARCDVILAGTGTVLIDDPELTVRDTAGVPTAIQPTRAVMGLRSIPSTARVLNEAAPTIVLPTRDPQAALGELRQREYRHVLLEGGPRLAAAFLRGGVVDEVVSYVAPMLLGAGLPAVGDLGIGTIGAALHFQVQSVATIGEGAEANVKITMTPIEREQEAGKTCSPE